VLPPQLKRIAARFEADRDGDQPGVDDEVSGAEERDRHDQLRRRPLLAEERLDAGSLEEQGPRRPHCERQVGEVEADLVGRHPAVPRQHQRIQCQRDRAGLRAEQQNASERENFRDGERGLDAWDAERDSPGDQREPGEDLPRRRHARRRDVHQRVEKQDSTRDADAGDVGAERPHSGDLDRWSCRVPSEQLPGPTVEFDLSAGELGS
jgi:hypothetical protein